MKPIAYFMIGIFCTVQSFVYSEDLRGAQYKQNPFVIKVDLPIIQTNAGGIVVADLNNDGQFDYLVTIPGYIAAYQHNGKKLWILKIDIRVSARAEKNGLPGNHASGLQAGDVDGDNKTEVLFLTQDSVLHVFDGETGKEEWNIKLPVPSGAKQWEHIVLANFRGKGDRDILLQTTNADGYRVGHFLAAYSLDALNSEHVAPLWHRDGFVPCAHNGARVADLDDDGKDEVLGAMILGPDGEILVKIPLQGHLDAVLAADVLVDVEGLEVVGLEEGAGNHVFLYNAKTLLWKKSFGHQEAQNTVIGDFDEKLPGLEIWCRSRHDVHQEPFVFGATGVLVRAYKLDAYLPEDWVPKGVEEIWTIDWTGEKRQLAVAKERHRAGDLGIFDPVKGVFLKRIKEEAERLYIADVSGDWREELIVINANEIHVYHNEQPNPNPDRERLWKKNHYKRSKMTWSYYST